MISVYQITSPSGKRYIGVSKNVEQRWLQHSRSEYPIGRAIRKYGDKMEYKVLVIVEDYETAFEIEKGLIKSFKTKVPNGYNLTDGGEGLTGYKFTESHKRRISESATGKPLSKEHKRKLSESCMGKFVTQGTKDKMSQAQRNPRFLRSDNKSGFVGVSFDKNNKFWKAYIYKCGKQELKQFRYKQDAINWRKAKSVEYGYNKSEM